MADITPQVELDLNQDGTFTDISARVRTVQGSYGRQSGLYEYRTGTASIQCHSDDNWIAPGASGAQYDAAELTGARCRISGIVDGTRQAIFSGWIDDIKWQGNNLTAGAQIKIVDSFSRLAGEQITATLPAELTGERINRILDLAGFPSESNDRDIDGGTIFCEELEVEEESAIGLLRQCAVSESGLLAVIHTGTVGGTLTFRQRQPINETLLKVSDGSQADDSTISASREPITEQDPRLLINRVIFTLPDGIKVFSENLESVARHGGKVLNQKVMGGFSDMQDLADWWIDLFSQSIFRVSSVDSSPHFETNNKALLALQATIGDVIETDYVPAAATQSVKARSFIDGVKFNINALDPENAAARVELRWSLFPADSSAYWVVGDSSAGVLGSTTRLAPPISSEDIRRHRNRPAGRVRWTDGEAITASGFSGGISSQALESYDSFQGLTLNESDPQTGQSAKTVENNRGDVFVYTGRRWTRELVDSDDLILPAVGATIANYLGEDTWSITFTEPVNEADATNPANYRIAYNSGDTPIPLPADTTFSFFSSFLFFRNAITDGGETLSIVEDSIRSAFDDRRFVDPATYTVPEPTTPITATVSGVEVGSTVIQIVFSEDVVAADAINPENYFITLSHGQHITLSSNTGTTYGYDAATRMLTITSPPAGFFRYGETFSVVGGTIQADDSSGRTVEAASVSIGEQPIYGVHFFSNLGESSFGIAFLNGVYVAPGTDLESLLVLMGFQGTITSLTLSAIYTFHLSEPLDGGETVIIPAYTVPTEDGNFIQEISFTVPEPTNPITASISATVGSNIVLIDYSEPIVGSDTEAATAFRLNNATFPFGTTYSYNAGLNRTTITSSRELTWEDEIRVISGLINADDSSGRTVSGNTFTLPAQPPVSSTISGVRGQEYIDIVYEHPVENDDASNLANFRLSNFNSSSTFSITYYSSIRTTTIVASQLLDGGETVEILADSIRALGGAYVAANSYTVPEPTAEITSTILPAEAGDTSFQVQFSENVLLPVQAQYYQINGTDIPSAGGVYDHTSFVARINLSRALEGGDVITVVDGVIPAFDSSGRFASGDTYTVEAPPLPTTDLRVLEAQVGGLAFYIFFGSVNRSPADQAAALMGDNYLINGQPSGATMLRIQSSRYWGFVDTPFALGDVISLKPDTILTHDGTHVYVGSKTLTAADNLSLTYEITAEPDTNIVSLVFNHALADEEDVIWEGNFDGGTLRAGVLIINSTDATGSATFDYTTNTLTLTLDQTLVGNDVLTFADQIFLSAPTGIYLPGFSYTIPAPEPPADNRPRITLAAHNLTAAPLLLQWEYDDTDFVQHAIQVRRKSYRPEGRAPNRGLTLERELWPVRHRYRTNNNTRYHHFENAELNDAGDIITSDLTLNIPGNWAGGSTPIHMAIRAREATGDWTEWSDDFLVDIREPAAHSPVATFTSHSINSDNELTLNWNYSDEDNSPQATYSVWTIGDGTANGNTWRYEPVSGRAGSLAQAAPIFTTGSTVRSAFINDGWLNTGITTEDYVVFYLMVVDGSGHRSITDSIRVEKP